jgi:hypothetical protein
LPELIRSCIEGAQRGFQGARGNRGDARGPACEGFDSRRGVERRQFDQRCRRAGDLGWMVAKGCERDIL